MCGRKTLTKGKLEIIEELSVEDWEDDYDFEPSYNVAPTQTHPILIHSNRRAVRGMRWGLVPFWAKDIKMGARMINARSETVSEKPSFRNLIKRNRCIAIADGYFEWQRKGSQKQPYFIHRPDNRLLPLAALWDRWQQPDGSDLHSYTILTCAPSSDLAFIHDRMPVILADSKMDTWLSDSLAEQEEILSLLHPPEAQLEFYPVSTQVNSVTNNSPENIVRISNDLFS